MAKTSYPIVWNFYRNIGNAKELGGVVHYFNEESQSIYLNDGLATKTAFVDEGHWKDAELSAETKVTDDSWSVLRLDHPSNSSLYGAATDGKTLTFIRYVYGLNLSDIIESWDWSSQVDNAITQFNASVMNINSSIFSGESSLLQPGARMNLCIFMGDSDPYPISVIWLDEADGDERSDTIKISGRNTIGYYLRDQTFDDNTKWEGATKTIVENILKYAGINRFIVQHNNSAAPFEFKPSDSILNGLEKIKEYYTTLDDVWEIAELSDGTIVIGYESWLNEYVPKGYYTFDEGRDVFLRKTRKSADGAYTSLRVTGKDINDNELQPVTIEIKNYRYWSLGAHRTKHLTAPDGKTQEELQAWAEAQAKKYKYVGITEEFSGPFRPQLLVGDVAAVKKEDDATILGIITEVRHTFSVKNGFKTEFSVDSGGVVMSDGVEIDEITNDFIVDPNAIVYSRAAQVNGNNRKTRIMDIVRVERYDK